MREEIEKKLDKLLEPPPVKFIKPLPKPIDPGRKKRGGKRVRKMKERYAITEFRKQANRMNFADVSISNVELKHLKINLQKNNYFKFCRLKVMHIRKILDTHEVQLVKQAQEESDCHKLMKKRRLEFQKPYKRICKNNNIGVAVQLLKNKFLEQLLV